MSDGCDAWFTVEPPPAPAMLRTYFRGRDGRLGMFEVEQVGSSPIGVAINTVKDHMKTSVAMVSIAPTKATP